MELFNNKITLPGLRIEAVDLSDSPQIAAELMKGQITALTELGVGGAVLNEEDFELQPGTYASIVRSDSGEIIGGVKICTRIGGRKLPIELENPFGSEFTNVLKETPSVCEIKGLWISRKAAGRHLSRRVTAHGTALGYLLGYQAIVGVAHERAFDFVSSTLGYVKDSRFPARPYPDDRFMSFVVWHYSGLADLRERELMSPRVGRRIEAAAV